LDPWPPVLLVLLLLLLPPVLLVLLLLPPVLLVLLLLLLLPLVLPPVLLVLLLLLPPPVLLVLLLLEPPLLVLLVPMALGSTPPLHAATTLATRMAAGAKSEGARMNSYLSKSRATGNFTGMRLAPQRRADAPLTALSRLACRCGHASAFLMALFLTLCLRGRVA
jgi:hypothetical protein